jgi:hypothetical protein
MKIEIEDTQGNTLMAFTIDGVITSTDNCEIADVREDEVVRLQQIREEYNHE